ncbi:unnamed protein product [Cochlearia groenlandica]
MTSVRVSLHELNLASRKAEESAARRFQAVQWLQSVIGEIDIPNKPTEKEFISCLRNGMILCNAINKIHPGSVPKVVESYSRTQSCNREYHLPQAYQYFENVRNFLVALQHLRLPGFEASDLEKDNIECGSVTKVVDCILGLKSYHECKITSKSCNVVYKHVKTPMFMLSAANKIHTPSASKTSRHLDMDRDDLRTMWLKLQNSRVKFEKIISRFPEVSVQVCVAFRAGNKLITYNINVCIYKQLQLVFKEVLNEDTAKPSGLKSMPMEELPLQEEEKSNRSSLLCKTSNNHKRLLKTQENELAGLKALFTQTKQDFKEYQVHLQRDLMELGNQMEEMSSAAQGYYKVVEENRKLYNMVQDLKGNIRVYCRVRPIFNSEMKGVIDYIGKDGSLFVMDPSKHQKDARKTFQFNQVFGPRATQDDVFRETQPFIRSVMDGYNVCIFAYGQTGSGKTYTMSGPPGRSANEMGINYLALTDLFMICDKRKDMVTYEIYVQMVEIYNEQVRDLLAENSSCTKYPFYDIRTCSNEEDGLSLPDATMHSVMSTMDVLKLMEAGEVNRAVSSTSMNNQSSRSHSILMVHVRGKDTSGGTLRSCLHLVDLAGSERVEKSEVTGDRLKEAQYINKSLSCLGDVIYALAQKNSHIPYRNSKLTLLLQDSLGGQAKTLMFAHLSPEEDSFGETISTLKFAQRVSTVELGAARAQKETREVLHLKEQIEYLKKALSTEDSNSVVSYSGAKEIKSPYRRPTEITPQRFRRSSMENSSSTKTNLEDRKGIKSPMVSRRAERSGLEGPKSFKIVEHGKGDSTMEVQQVKSPLNPLSSYRSNAVKGDAVKGDGRTSIHQLQILKTPEKVASRNDIQTISLDSKTNGKGSQIRKSLRTIGKLINGSEKRKENIHVNPRSPLGVSNNFNGVKSPHTSNAKTLRRQSLTGVMPSRPHRRSSIGGKQVENCNNGARNAKTPPPMRSSTNMEKKRA